MRGFLTSQGRFLGYLPDPSSRRTQLDARTLVEFSRGKSTAPLQDAASLAPFRAPIEDQGMTGSCGGHGSSQLTTIAIGAAHSDDPMNVPALGFVPSPDGIYKMTRVVMRSPNSDGTEPPLTDSGVVPADLVVAISKFGLRPMRAPTPDGRNSDVDPSTVNFEPDFADTEESYRDLAVGEYRIDESASDVIDVVCGVISQARRPVGIGIFVDTRFMNWKAGEVPPSTIDFQDSNGGGHWICIDGYQTGTAGNFGEANNGKRIFSIPNSWGLEAGDQGVYLVTEDWVRQASDLYAWTMRIARAA